MPERPFTPDQLDELVAALHGIEGTESEEQVVIFPSGRGRGRFDTAHLDEEFCVYVEWPAAVPFSSLGLALPDDHELYDVSTQNATIGLGDLGARRVAELFVRWVPMVFGDAPLVWTATAEEG